MAAAAAAATDQSVQLKVFVEKERNKFLYAEAGKDFVDVLFSFLTLPLGTIARLVSKESNIKAVRVGSLSSLYQGVVDLDDQYLSTPICKEMLLNPRNSMEDYCRSLKLNIDDIEPVRYFRCNTHWGCYTGYVGRYLSTFRNQKCFCGKLMEAEIIPNFLNQENGFVKENATFIISDDLHVMPNDWRTAVRLLKDLGVDNSGTIQEQTVDINKKEVVDLLKLSLLSKTPLTNYIFNNKKIIGKSTLGKRNQSGFGLGMVVAPEVGKSMDLKVMVRKSNGAIVFAEAEEDFVDFLFSFLTFPLGGVLQMLEGFPSLGCLNNIYQSMNELSPDSNFISLDHKDKLAKPMITPIFNLTSQILPIRAASLPTFYGHTYYDTNGNIRTDLRKDKMYSNSVQLSFVDPKSTSSSTGEFVKGPSTYMVTGDLVVTPMSSTSPMLYLNKSKVPLFDLEEKVIKIGMKEGLAILKASLISTTALTTGLNQFIATVKEPTKRRTIKEEK